MSGDQKALDARDAIIREFVIVYNAGGSGQFDVTDRYGMAGEILRLRSLFDRFERLIRPEDHTSLGITSDEGAEDLNACVDECWRVVERCMESNNRDVMIADAHQLHARSVASLLMMVESFCKLLRYGSVICTGCNAAFSRDEIAPHVAQCAGHPLAQENARLRTFEPPIRELLVSYDALNVMTTRGTVQELEHFASVVAQLRQLVRERGT